MPEQGSFRWIWWEWKSFKGISRSPQAVDGGLAPEICEVDSLLIGKLGSSVALLWF